MNKSQDVFSGCHPLINFLYFAVVILISVFVDHPLVLGISFAGALTYAVVLKGWKKVAGFNLLLTLPAMFIVALINPMFNHNGVTFLFYLKTGPVTLEAVVYGIVLASMLFITILWFTCFNEVMTTDKFVYLFGRVMPSMSLVLSMVFRFVPRFGARLAVIRRGQKTAGGDVSSGGLLRRIKYGIRILSILITWALENAIETADSMRARGYGLKGRTAFSNYRFDRRDLGLFLVMTTLMAVFFAGVYHGAAYACYDPAIKVGGFPPDISGLPAYLAWAVFCFLPTILKAGETLKFKRLSRAASADRNLPWYLKEQERRTVI